MNNYKKFSILFLIFELMLVVVANIYIVRYNENSLDKQYKVEVQRIINEVNAGQELGSIDIDEYKSIISVKKYNPEEKVQNEYLVKEIDGQLYRFEYIHNNDSRFTIIMNIIFGIILVSTSGLLWYLNRKLIIPFNNIHNLPTELAKGNLSVPIKEEKSKFFGKFLWGMDMLREKLEDDKLREYELIKEKKTLILSLSHDVKTPLSAIDLYVKALKEGLYDTDEKKQEVFLGIEKNINEIKGYVNEIAKASREDFLSLDVNNKEVYLWDIIKMVKMYYSEKMRKNHTDFIIEETVNCLIYADTDRLVEVLQNVIENALKYGDGKKIDISFDEEEDCKLIVVSNTGNSLKEEEIPNLFDSFYRGSNSGNIAGSGLGLYISKELMHKMDGDIYIAASEDIFKIVLVLRKM
ncbi:MAG: HAMP domain-containing sensor histidine kinase [Agathobacter sp.]|nr:HAMP domain-containing sensor histidine kinase [Agathobacter sp.]